MTWIVEPIVNGLAVPVASFDGVRFYCARTEDAELVARILNGQEAAHEATRAELAEAKKLAESCRKHEMAVASERDALEHELTAAQASEAKLRHKNKALATVAREYRDRVKAETVFHSNPAVIEECHRKVREIDAALSPPDRREQIAARVPSGEELEGGARGLEIPK